MQLAITRLPGALEESIANWIQHVSRFIFIIGSCVPQSQPLPAWSEDGVDANNTRIPDCCKYLLSNPGARRWPMRPDQPEARNSADEAALIGRGDVGRDSPFLSLRQHLTTISELRLQQLE